MNIYQNLERLLKAKEELRLGIIDLGVEVSKDAKIDEYASKIDKIDITKTKELLDGSITSLDIKEEITKIGDYALANCSSLTLLRCFSTVPPTLSNSALSSTTLTEIIVPSSAYYSYKIATNWSSKSDILKSDLENIVYKSLSITALDVIGNETTTAITYTFVVDGDSLLTGEHVTNTTYTDTCISDTFELNTSETEAILRTITLTMNGLTASATITLGIFLPPILLNIGENSIDNSYVGNTLKTWSNRTGRLYSFIAPETATYKFSFNDNITGGSAMDTYGYILNEAADTQLSYNDDSAGNSDPLMSCACTAGTVYQVLITPYSTSSTANVIGILTISKS